MTDDLKSFKAPGLSWRPRPGDRWEARWRAHPDYAARGYKPSVVHLWTGKATDFTETDMAVVASRCATLHSAMSVWAAGGIKRPEAFDGTIRSLIRLYETDPDSTYRQCRHHTKQTYGSHLRVIMADHGSEKIASLRGRQLRHWHEAWLPRGATMAHGLIGMLRTLMTYGATILDDDKGNAACLSVQVLLSKMRFSRPGARQERLTADQVIAIRAKAHLMGVPSIALAQALQFECTLRQRDVIGEWVPESEPGISDVTLNGEKWLRGVRWNEIDGNLILRHMTSKRQKMVEVDLRNAPMVLEEFALLDARPTSGPIVIRDEREVPWQAYDFRRFWRKVADAAGIPKSVHNMDSRAGAITEATQSGARLEAVRKAATHGNIAMTQKYDRGDAEDIAEVMRSRVAHRNKQRT